MGPHRCLGSRLAELQLRVLWEEVLSRDLEIEVLAPPTYAFSNLVRSPVKLPVRIGAEPTTLQPANGGQPPRLCENAKLRLRHEISF
jgi:hypothetical protein